MQTVADSKRKRLRIAADQNEFAFATICRVSYGLHVCDIFASKLRFSRYLRFRFRVSYDFDFESATILTLATISISSQLRFLDPDKSATILTLATISSLSYDSC